ncbi:sigma-70 family RNA polymerase sigma factor [Puteibacter caeruleilacunae]|nr:sigma-70 family RNA polymerase sigma factor [Puteibacter caeruleilacunae]
MAQKEIVHSKLIKDCIKGKSRAKYKLYELYSQAMFNVCYRMMNNREEAEDMLQEAFVLAFQKLDSFRFESSFGHWLKRLTINQCINQINKRKVDLIYCDDYYPNLSSDEEKPKEINVSKINEAMEQLPEGGRLVFSLYLLEGYDHSEIAEILAISESTSKTQYMRAKRKIASILKTEETLTE